jgi:hypothetical protein
MRKALILAYLPHVEIELRAILAGSPVLPNISILAAGWPANHFIETRE